MKSLLGKLGIDLIAFGLTILCSTGVQGGTDWKYYGANQDGSYFYRTESMAKSSRNIVRVWVHSTYTDQGITRWVRGGGKEFQDLGSTLVLSELDCVYGAFRSLQIIFYSKSGEVIKPVPSKEWEFFAPDSMSEALYHEVCNTNSSLSNSPDHIKVLFQRWLHISWPPLQFVIGFQVLNIPRGDIHRQWVS